MSTRDQDEARDRHPGTAERVGEVTGGIGGTVAGAALGSAAGPVGTIIGAIAGALGGWWAGEQAGRALEDWGEHEPYYREDFHERDPDIDWDGARVGYSVGHVAGRNPDYAGRRFEAIEPDIREQWEDPREYERLRPYVVSGYLRSSTLTD
ncbi:MAG TPA: hypothetical protein VK858_17700 [Longimicrobiales bacterium]|nr:hypothetical protein [Longimicrobiales bacterium]